MAAYIASALNAQAQGRKLPFVIIRKSSGSVVGSTRFFHIEPYHRRVKVGYTLLASVSNAPSSEAKLLLLTHAFERLGCIRVEFVTDVLNYQSRTAITCAL